MLGSKTIFYFDHILTLVLHKYLKKIDLRIFKTYRLILILFTFADFFFSCPNCGTCICLDMYCLLSCYIYVSHVSYFLDLWLVGYLSQQKFQNLRYLKRSHNDTSGNILSVGLLQAMIFMGKSNKVEQKCFHLSHLLMFT